MVSSANRKWDMVKPFSLLETLNLLRVAFSTSILVILLEYSVAIMKRIGDNGSIDEHRKTSMGYPFPPLGTGKLA